MSRAVVFAFAALAFGAAAEDRPHPTFEEFTANIHYPYYATTARQRQIKRGAQLLHKGMGETAVLQLMGPADYKVGWFDPVRNAHGQSRTLPVLSAVMMAASEAEEAWCPPTFRPSELSRR